MKFESHQRKDDQRMASSKPDDCRDWGALGLKEEREVYIKGGTEV